MSLGEDEYDVVAYALVQAEYDFDAVESGNYRAEWTEDGTAVEVTDIKTGETVVYNAEDLVRAESDREVSNARTPTEE